MYVRAECDLLVNWAHIVGYIVSSRYSKGVGFFLWANDEFRADGVSEQQ